MRLLAITLLACASLAPAWSAAEDLLLGADARPESTERIAVLDFMLTEIALAIGIEPVAVARPEGYRRWVGLLNQRIDRAVDVGLRQEPSLEALAGARPDLILGSNWRHGPALDRLRGIAPTLLYRSLPEPREDDQLTRIREIVRDLGRRTGRAEQAATALETMDAAFAETRARIRRAGREGTPVVIAQHAIGTTRFHLYSPGSLGVRVAERIGLDNAWSGEYGTYGFQTVRAETLAELGDDAHLLLMVEPDDTAFERLRDSPVWAALPAVAGGRVHRLPPYTWFYGGPLSAARLGERFADALLGAEAD